MTQEQIEARRKARQAAKDAARIEAERNQKPVKAVTITIEWKKSRMWGSNPHCEASVEFHDGTYERSPVFKCSGCGYDKTSTVIADVFNRYLLYKLWAMTPEQIKGGRGSGDKGNAPYGINYRQAETWKDSYGREHHNPEHRYFAGGIGANCYQAISEYIGGQWEHTADGKMFDVFKYTDGKAKASK